MQVAIEVVIVPIGDLVQMVFESVGPAVGYGLSASIAFLFLKAYLRWMRIL